MRPSLASSPAPYPGAYSAQAAPHSATVLPTHGPFSTAPTSTLGDGRRMWGEPGRDGHWETPATLTEAFHMRLAALLAAHA